MCGEQFHWTVKNRAPAGHVPFHGMCFDLWKALTAIVYDCASLEDFQRLRTRVPGEPWTPKA